MVHHSLKGNPIMQAGDCISFDYTNSQGGDSTIEFGLILERFDSSRSGDAVSVEQTDGSVKTYIISRMSNPQVMEVL